MLVLFQFIIMKNREEAYSRVTTDHITYNSQNVEKSDTESLGRKIISLIILAYFVIVFIQVCPSGPIRDRARAFVDPVIQLFGLKQRWNLFSPEIRLVNQYASCLITFKDGSVKLYEWPENRKFSFSEGIERNQLRKFVVDGINEPFYRDFWPGGARYLAVCHWNPDNPPVLVQPVFNGLDVPRFEEYTKQSELDLHTIRHRTVNCIFEVQERDMPQDEGIGK